MLRMMAMFVFEVMLYKRFSFRFVLVGVVNSKIIAVYLLQKKNLYTIVYIYVLVALDVTDEKRRGSPTYWLFNRDNVSYWTPNSSRLSFIPRWRATGADEANKFKSLYIVLLTFNSEMIYLQV